MDWLDQLGKDILHPFLGDVPAATNDTTGTTTYYDPTNAAQQTYQAVADSGGNPTDGNGNPIVPPPPATFPWGKLLIVILGIGVLGYTFRGAAKAEAAAK